MMRGAAKAIRDHEAPASEPSSQLITAARRSPDVNSRSATPAESSDETA